MESTLEQSRFFGREKISKILLKLAPPVMLAQLIQALYNIVDSLFVGRYADSGLTALSIIYPIQLLMIALAVGTGVGINTAMAARLGVGQKEKADEFAGVGTPLAIALWFLFAIICWFFMPVYARMSTSSPDVIADVITYGRIVCVLSFGLFLESIWTKVLQANGNMKTPMIAQILGAVNKHYFRSFVDFWTVWPTRNGNRRCGHSYGCRANRSRSGSYEEGISEIACGKPVSKADPGDLPPGCS